MDDDRNSLRVVGDVRNLCPGKQRGNRRNHCAKLENCEVGDDRGWDRWGSEKDPIPLANTKLTQRIA
jgi:hypothetical protein